MYMNKLYFHSCTKNFHKKDINGMDLRILMYSLYILINLMKYNFFYEVSFINTCIIPYFLVDTM